MLLIVSYLDFKLLSKFSDENRIMSPWMLKVTVFEKKGNVSVLDTP